MSAQVWATLGIGVFGFIGVIATILQRTRADNRAEWWRRAAWAVDHALSDNLDAQLVGFSVLEKLQSSKLATSTDNDIFAVWIEQLFAFGDAPPGDTAAGEVDNGGSEEERDDDQPK